MPRNKRAWSYVTGERRRNRVRVFERSRDHLVLLEWWVEGHKRCQSLGHRTRTEAKQAADALASSLGEPTRRDSAVTLFDICSAYLRERTPQKSLSVQRHDKHAARLLSQILGSNCHVIGLTHRDAARFVTERRKLGDFRPGKRFGKPISSRQVAYDVGFAKAVLNWATGAGLLPRSP